MMKSMEWFTVDQVDKRTYIISEYKHWEETHCYLLIGSNQALLIDTGLGIGNIREVVQRLTNQPVIAAATHIHWDHIGGHRHFPDFAVHRSEVGWLNGGFPLPVQAVRNMILDCTKLPAGFDINSYELFRGTPTRLLEDGDAVNLGDRVIYALHTPGHSPGHLCFWEPEFGYLFSGDLVYRGTLFACYPSTDPQRYLESLDKICQLPVNRIFPGHHSLDIQPELARRMRDAFRRLNQEGRLCHGGGTFYDADWSVRF